MVTGGQTLGWSFAVTSVMICTNCSLQDCETERYLWRDLECDDLVCDCEVIANVKGWRSRKRNTLSARKWNHILQHHYTAQRLLMLLLLLLQLLLQSYSTFSNYKSFRRRDYSNYHCVSRHHQQTRLSYPPDLHHDHHRDMTQQGLQLMCRMWRRGLQICPYRCAREKSYARRQAAVFAGCFSVLRLKKIK